MSELTTILFACVCLYVVVLLGLAVASEYLSGPISTKAKFAFLVWGSGGGALILWLGRWVIGKQKAQGEHGKPVIVLPAKEPTPFRDHAVDQLDEMNADAEKPKTEPEYTDDELAADFRRNHEEPKP